MKKKERVRIRKKESSPIFKVYKYLNKLQYYNIYVYIYLLLNN